MSIKEKDNLDSTNSQEMAETTTSSSHGGTQTFKTASSIHAHARSGSNVTSGGGIPHDKIRLDVLLISGQRRFFLFDPSSNVKSVRERIWEDWPEDWPMKPDSSNSMRILHLGHILDDKTVLYQQNNSQDQKSAIIPGAFMPGKSSVVHLLMRQEPSKSINDDDSPKKKSNKSGEVDEETQSGCCGCVIC